MKFTSAERGVWRIYETLISARQLCPFCAIVNSSAHLRCVRVVSATCFGANRSSRTSTGAVFTRNRWSHLMPVLLGRLNWLRPKSLDSRINALRIGRRQNKRNEKIVQGAVAGARQGTQRGVTRSLYKVSGDRIISSGLYHILATVNRSISVSTDGLRWRT